MQAQARYASSVALATTTATSLNNVQMNDDSYPPLPQNEESVAYSTDNPHGRRCRRERLRERRHRRHADDRRRTDVGKHAGRSGLPPDQRHLQRWRPGHRVQRSRPRVLPVAALLLPATAAVRGPDLQVARQRRDVDPRVVGRPSPRRTTTRRRERSTRTRSTTRSTSTIDNNPSSPHYGRLYVTYTRFHIADDGSSDTCPIKLAYTDSVPSQDPSLAVWTPDERRARRSGRGRLGILGEPVLGPGRREEREARHRVHPRGVQHVARPRPAVPELDERRRELLVQRQREQARAVGRQPGRVAT